MKVYTALRFAERPDLHMTLTHYGDVNDMVVAALVDRTDEKVRMARANQFVLTLPHEALFGPRHDIHVLLPAATLPAWVGAFVPPDWVPHVSCADKGLFLTVACIALMTKQTEIKHWELP
jgi:hypothetical protein